jgi:hypothetical protein
VTSILVCYIAAVLMRAIRRVVRLSSKGVLSSKAASFTRARGLAFRTWSSSLHTTHSVALLSFVVRMR